MAEESAGKTLAIFDFDDTLTHGDTLGLWLAAIAGWPILIICAATASIGCWFTGRGPDRRTRFKDLLWRRILANLPLEKATIAAHQAVGQIKWRSETCAILEKHHKEGRLILIATGAARFCAEIFIAHKFGTEGIFVMGTELSAYNDHFTGDIAGGNCVRIEKARRVAEWIATNGPFDRIYGYGNTPHDLPMLALVTDTNII